MSFPPVEFRAPAKPLKYCRASAPCPHRKLLQATVPRSNPRPLPRIPPDEIWMEEALRRAQRALEGGEVPVGAVVVCDGRIVGSGWNRNITDSIPPPTPSHSSARAGATVGNHRLEDCELFATIEPCAMCAGALVHARIQPWYMARTTPRPARSFGNGSSESSATEPQNRGSR